MPWEQWSEADRLRFAPATPASVIEPLRLRAVGHMAVTPRFAAISRRWISSSSVTRLSVKKIWLNVHRKQFQYFRDL